MRLLIVGAGAALAAWVGVSFLQDAIHGGAPDGSTGYGGLPRGSHAGTPPADYFSLRPEADENAYQGSQGGDDSRPGDAFGRMPVPSGYGSAGGFAMPDRTFGGGHGNRRDTDDGAPPPGWSGGRSPHVRPAVSGGFAVDRQGRPYRRWRDCWGDRYGKHRCGPWNYGPAPGDPLPPGEDR